MTTSCPRCFTRLDPDVRLYQCPGPCQQFDDPVASAYRGLNGLRTFPTQSLRRQGERNWNPQSAMPCRICRKPMRDICPTCHHVLPQKWREGSAVCVALAGARATGKSIYVGVLIKQLEQLMHEMGSLLRFGDAGSGDMYAAVYESKLYASRSVMQSTIKSENQNAYAAIPMIINLGLVDGVTRYLVIRDVAGEDLEAPAPDTTYLSYFQNAHAVFFLFDPLAVTSVQELLRGIIPEQLMKSGNQQRVLLNLLRIIGSASPPIAMIMSKFDTLQSLRDHQDSTWRAVMANSGAAFQRDPGSLATRFNSDDAALLHLEVRSLLQLLNAQQFVNAMSDPQRSRPYDHQYFAVSALGGSANGEQLHPHGIAPFRCLDPLRWVLHREGVL